MGRELVARLPELRFNADLSHYVTGHLLDRPGAAETLDALAPILARVRFIHGRLSDAWGAQLHRAPGVGVDAPAEWPLFRELWTRCMAGFLRDAGPGDVFVFAPELLPTVTGYAEITRGAGRVAEVGDRARIADALCDAARDCFAEARARVDAGQAASSWRDLAGTWSDAPPRVVSSEGTLIVRALTPDDLDAALRPDALRDARVVRLRLGTGTESLDEMVAWGRRVLDAQRETEAALLCETYRGTFLRHITRAAALARALPALRFALDPAGWLLSHEFFPNQFASARAAMAPVIAATELLVVGHASSSRVGRFHPPVADGLVGVTDRVASRYLHAVHRGVAENGHDARWVPGEMLHALDLVAVTRRLQRRPRLVRLGARL